MPSIVALQHNRQHYRMYRYQEFVTFWHQEQGIWERSYQTLDATVEHTNNAGPTGMAGPPITSH